MNFDLIWNSGIGFGLLSSDSTLFYNLITLIISGVIFFLIYLIIKSSFSDKVFFINSWRCARKFYDRVVYFAVPDFIDFHYKTFHWFTFNIADIFITIGILLIIIKDLFFKKKC